LPAREDCQAGAGFLAGPGKESGLVGVGSGSIIAVVGEFVFVFSTRNEKYTNILQFKHSSLMEKMEEELQYKENEMQVIGILKQYWQEVEGLVLEGPPEGSAVRLNKTSSLVQAALGLGGRIVTSEQTTPDSE